MILSLMNPPSFRFLVAVDKIPVAAFTECSLPTLELEVEEVKEGGLNTYVHQLPGRRKPARITLKKGVGSTVYLVPWYIKGFEESFSRKQVTITLLNALLMPVMVWFIEDAYPTKWTGPELKSDNNAIAIHSLELACGRITVMTT